MTHSRESTDHAVAKVSLRMRQRIFVLSAILIIVVGGVLLYLRKEETGLGLPREVRIAFQTIPNGEMIVRQQGWLESALAEQGVQVRWVNFASGSDVNAALASGDVDIGLVGSTLFAIGVERGIPYDLIWIHDVIGESEALVARTDRGINTVADLKGRVVATPFGSTTHYTVLEALKKGGLTPSDVTLVDLKPQDIIAAWTRGDIDAAYVWQPTLAVLEDQGGRVLISSADLVADGVVTADLGAVQTDFLRKYPGVVETYLNVQARAVTLINRNRDEAALIIADALGITPDEVLPQLAGMQFVEACDQRTADWLGSHMTHVIHDTADFLVKQGILTGLPTLDEIAARISTSALQDAGC